MKSDKFLRIVKCLSGAQKIEGRVVRYNDDGFISVGDISGRFDDEQSIAYAAINQLYKTKYHMETCTKAYVLDFIWSVFASRYGLNKVVSCINKDRELSMFATETENGEHLLKIYEDDSVITSWLFTDLYAECLYDAGKFGSSSAALRWAEDILYNEEVYDYTSLYKTCKMYLELVKKAEYKYEGERKSTVWVLHMGEVSCRTAGGYFNTGRPKQECRLNLITFYQYICGQCTIKHIHKIYELAKSYVETYKTCGEIASAQFAAWLIEASKCDSLFDGLYSKLKAMLSEHNS